MEQIEKTHWPTVLIMEGIPYVLKRKDNVGVFDVCEYCDLKTFCQSSIDDHNFFELCYSDGRDNNWYFEEDWTIFAKNIFDFLEIKDKKGRTIRLSEQVEKSKTIKFDV